MPTVILLDWCQDLTILILLANLLVLTLPVIYIMEYMGVSPPTTGDVCMHDLEVNLSSAVHQLIGFANHTVSV